MKKKSKKELPEYEKLEIKYKLLQKKYKALNKIKGNLETELNDIKGYYETFFNLFDEMLFITKPDGRIIFANKLVSEKLKFSQEELIGKLLLDIIPEDRSSEALENIQEILEGKRDICPIPVITKDGLTIPVETRVLKARW